MSSDVLKYLDCYELSLLLLKLKENLPGTIRGHHYLFHYLKNYEEIQKNSKKENFSARCKIKIYGYSKGNLDNCTFIGISSDEDCWVFMCSSEKSGEELEKCIEQTNLINWSLPKLFISVDEVHFHKIKEILLRKQQNWEFAPPEGVYCLNKELAMTFQDGCDNLLEEGISFRELTLDDAGIINDFWPHKYPGSLIATQTLIKLNGGTGLTKNGKLIAWIAQNDLFSPGFLYTVEDERKKGYGSRVTKAECYRLAKRYNLDVVLYIVHGNHASQSVMQKIGFKPIQETRFISPSHSD